MAKENGADLAKFQLFDADDDKGNPHYNWVKTHELTFEQAKMLFDYGALIGQEVFFSVFGVKYVEWCEKIGVKRYKIACGMREYEVLEAVKKTFKPLIISGNDNVFYQQKAMWLYCIPEYPAPFDHIKMPHFTPQLWRKWTGYSDHTIGLDIVKIALSRGAQIVEKHFVLEHNPDYPDDTWSMTPTEFRELKEWELICQRVL